MASGAGRSAAFMLLALNVLLYFVVIVVSAWAVNNAIERSHETASGLAFPAQLFPIYYPFGNMATGFMVVFSLVAGVVGFTTSVTGVSNVVQLTGPNLNAAAASSLMSCALTMLAMGFGCKEIDLGWTQSSLKVLETMLIVVSGTQLLCTVVMYMGVDGAVLRDNEVY